MVKGTDGVMDGAESTPVDGGGEPKKEQENPEAEAQRLEEQVDAIRDNLDGLVSELDHRRHEFMRKVRRYAVPVAIGAAAVGLAVAGGVVWRRVRRPTPTRIQRLGAALGRAVDHPERVARQQTSPTVARKLILAAGAAAVSVVARRLAQRWLEERH
ncbi:MAG: hypothetical protein QOI66_1847 [Myxococcales bacterium]|jgi:hypothetical protein|nr:hypothetical protein [Myxococcales bacterium]